MNDKKEKQESLKQRINNLCKQTNTPLPAEFLASVMAGIDPRKEEGSLFKLINKIALSGRQPTREQWEMVCDIVLSTDAYMKDRIDSVTSIKAAEKLIEFLEPKLKAVELSGTLNHNVSVAPMTKEQVKQFKDWWKEQY
jgi:hypothetical protein